MINRDKQGVRHSPRWRLLYLVSGTILLVALCSAHPGIQTAHGTVASAPALVSAFPTHQPLTPTKTAGPLVADLAKHSSPTSQAANASPTASATATNQPLTATPTATVPISSTLIASSDTDSDGSTAEATVQPLSPEQLAAQQAALRDAQYRMSRARTAFRLQAIAAAEAQLSDAQANLQRVIAASNQTATAAAARATPTPTATSVPTALPSVTSVTAADVAAAQTALQQAQAQLQTLTAKPAPAHIGALQAAVSAAQQSYATVAQTDSTAKTSAEQQFAKATSELHTAQATYNTALFQNQQAQLGIDPQTSQRFAGTAAATDSAKQHYAALFATAGDQLKAVQAQLVQVTAARDAAMQQERTDLAAAQTRVDQAQQALATAVQPPDPAAVATAQAQVATAQAQLTTLQTALAAVNAAQAQAKAQAQKQLADAQKNAAKLATPTASPAVAAAQLAVTQAQTQLTLARQGAVGSRGWMWPTFGTITSGFGLRDMAVGHFHNGVDIANPQGTPIGAARDGVVIEAGWCSGYGYCVKLQHTAGFESEYGHLAGPPPVKVGQVVSVGTIIGAMGTTYDEAGGGFSTGVHLHFTIRSYGVAVDPLRYLP